MCRAVNSPSAVAIEDTEVRHTEGMKPLSSLCVVNGEGTRLDFDDGADVLGERGAPQTTFPFPTLMKSIPPPIFLALVLRGGAANHDNLLAGVFTLAPNVANASSPVD